VFLLKLKYHLIFLSKKLINLILIQNIISIALIPIYSAWGISFSILSFIGNIVFAPFLTIFIILSVIIFFGFILQISISPAIFILKKTVDLWLYIMKYFNFNNSLYISFQNHEYLYFLICWPIAAILIFINKIESKKIKFIFHFFSFFIAISPKYFLNSKKNIIIKDNFSENRIAIAENTKENIYIFDYQKKQNKQKFDKWLLYSVNTNINKNFGNQKIYKYINC
jgi:hypothetical protein